jgi:hypothetical protein
MDFTSLKTRVAEETGLDATNDATKLGVWINEAYRFLAGMREWPWLMKSSALQTVADITSLTASVTAGGTSVTLSATYTPTLANDYYIQFSTTDDWYLITAHTAATDTLTISPAYQGSTNLSSGTCTIRKVFYSLASDVDRIIDLRQTITDRQLSYVDPRTFDRQLPDPSATGTPYVYTLLGIDSSRNWRANFYPIPSAKTNILYRYYQKITDLSGSSDVPMLPEKFHPAIVFTALAMFGHPYIDDSRMASAESRARMLVSEMVGQVSPIPDNHTISQPWDTRAGTRVNHGAAWPPNFNTYGR